MRSGLNNAGSVPRSPAAGTPRPAPPRRVPRFVPPVTQPARTPGAVLVYVTPNTKDVAGAWRPRGAGEPRGLVSG